MWTAETCAQGGILDHPAQIEVVAPLPGELVIQGHTYDKFLGTPLNLALRSQDIRYLTITGVLADVCVNCTLLAAANRDYRVTAVTDGVATLWPHLLQACFDLWARKFARLRTTAEVIAHPSCGHFAQCKKGHCRGPLRFVALNSRRETEEEIHY